MYRCDATSTFIRHLAVNLFSRGYYFYVKGEIPPDRDAEKLDAKIVERYGVNISKWARARRRKQGKATVQYVRCRQTFVILATHGEHHFFRDEAKLVQDVRRVPFKHGGYSISYWTGKATPQVSVKIEQVIFLQLKEYLLNRALRTTVEDFICELRSFRFPPFAPVRKQLMILVERVNRARKAAGLECIPVAAAVPTYRQRLAQESKRVRLNKPIEEAAVKV